MRKANDKGVPEDEMLLAEAIAAAKANNLKFLRYGMFALDGFVHNLMTKPFNSCCAYGALAVAGVVPGDFTKAPSHLARIPSGNDADEFSVDNGEPDHGESLGWAFRCAMTQGDES